MRIYNSKDNSNKQAERSSSTPLPPQQSRPLAKSPSKVSELQNKLGKLNFTGPKQFSSVHGSRISPSTNSDQNREMEHTETKNIQKISPCKSSDLSQPTKPHSGHVSADFFQKLNRSIDLGRTSHLKSSQTQTQDQDSAADLDRSKSQLVHLTRNRSRGHKRRPPSKFSHVKNSTTSFNISTFSNFSNFGPESLNEKNDRSPLDSVIDDTINMSNSTPGQNIDSQSSQNVVNSQSVRNSVSSPTNKLINFFETPKDTTNSNRSSVTEPRHN